MQADLDTWTNTFGEQSASEVQQEKAWMEQTLTTAQRDLEQKNHANNNLLTENKDLRETFNQQLNEVNQELVRTQKKKGKLDRHNSKLQTKLTTAQGEVNGLTGQLNKLQGDLSEKENNLSELKKSLQKKGNEIIDLQWEIRGHKDEIDRLKDNQKDLENPRANNTTEIENQLNEIKAKYTKTQKQAKTQSNFVESVLGCLAGAGITNFSWKTRKKYEEHELNEELDKIEVRVNDLIKEKKLAEDNQQQAEQELEQAQAERDYYKNQTNSQENYSSPVPSSCSHSDYQEVKEWKDNHKCPVKTDCHDNEKQIVQQLNGSLNLNLSELTLPQAISKIQGLINKPPIFSGSSSYSPTPSPVSNKVIERQLQEAQQTIINLEKELSTKDTPFGEDLEVIKSLELTSLEELFPGQVDSAFKEQIQQATNYQQLSSLRNAKIKKHLGQSLNNLQLVPSQKAIISPPPKKERIILISLLVVSLVSIGGLLVKMAKTKRLNSRS